ncbi:MAG TPA: hypothetical protein VFN10_23570 [Thermoanaerobaculia bacterium]|nr:hypothetical protein [Thermoanaerobaculia bacterium]
MARRHEASVDWKHLVVYGAFVVVVALVGGVAIWSFIERQTLVIKPEPLPKITVVVETAGSKLGASWVRVLTQAELQPTLVPLETFDPIEGVVVFCDVENVPPRLAALLDEFVRRGGAIAFAGKPPKNPIGQFRLLTEPGRSDAAMRLSETVSPVLARLVPATEIPVHAGTPVPMLKESPRMVVDVRWRDSARAAVMHVQSNDARWLWFGFDPASLQRPDPTLLALLRSSFRWLAGQPVSDGAVGPPQTAKTMTPDARKDARENGFAFSVDRTRDDDTFTVRMINRGGVPLPNPTVKIWMPPRVTRVAFAGDFIMTRSATLTGVPEDGTCLVSLPRLTRNEDRVMKLRITAQRAVPAAQQNAQR